VSLPAHLGFDCEIKFPSKENIPFAERNVFLDIVLNMLIDKEKLFFSSFDPFIVAMLTEKQVR
jgi:hypothetical protein